MQFVLVCVVSLSKNGIVCTGKGCYVVWDCTVWLVGLWWGCQSETRFHCAEPNSLGQLSELGTQALKSEKAHKI